MTPLTHLLFNVISGVTPHNPLTIKKECAG